MDNRLKTVNSGYPRFAVMRYARFFMNKGVGLIDWTVPRLRFMCRRTEVLKWNYLAIAVAGSAEVCAFVYRLVDICFRRIGPSPGNYFKELVLRLLFDFGFKVCFFSARLYQLHSRLLNLKLKAMELLHLGEPIG